MLKFGYAGGAQSVALKQFAHCPMKPSLLLRWHCSPVLNFALLMNFFQSAQFFYLIYQFLILHLLISVSTQFHYLFRGRPLSRLP